MQTLLHPLPRSPGPCRWAAPGWWRLSRHPWAPRCAVSITGSWTGLRAGPGPDHPSGLEGETAAGVGEAASWGAGLCRALWTWPLGLVRSLTEQKAEAQSGKASGPSTHGREEAGARPGPTAHRPAHPSSWGCCWQGAAGVGKPLPAAGIRPQHPGRAPWSPARAAASGLWLPSSTTEAPPGPILPDSPSPSTAPSHPRAWEPLTPPLGPLPGPGLPTSPHHPLPAAGGGTCIPSSGTGPGPELDPRAPGIGAFQVQPTPPPCLPGPSPQPSVRGPGPVRGPSLLGSLFPRLLLTPNLGCPCQGSSCTPLPAVVARPAHSCAGSVSAPAVGGGRWTPGLPSAVGSLGGGGGRWGEWAHMSLRPACLGDSPPPKHLGVLLPRPSSSREGVCGAQLPAQSGSQGFHVGMRGPESRC